jgi:hypothetical protein
MSQQLIPLSSSPGQQLSVTLQVDGSPLTLNLEFDYNEVAGYWVMQVSDSTNNLIVSDIPLLTGNNPACNILGQFAYLGIGSAYVINQSGTPASDYPNSQNLGSSFVLIWGDTPITDGAATPLGGSSGFVQLTGFQSAQTNATL